MIVHSVYKQAIFCACFFGIKLRIDDKDFSVQKQ